MAKSQTNFNWNGNSAAEIIRNYANFQQEKLLSSACSLGKHVWRQCVMASTDQNASNKQSITNIEAMIGVSLLSI